jgi:putative flippase GtrA
VKDPIYWLKMTTKVRHQLSSFILGGLIAVTLDWCTFFVLIHFCGISPNISKLISFLVVTVFAFYYNGIFSFQSNLGKSQFVRHLILYTFSMTMNLTVFTLSMRFSPTFLVPKSLLGLGLATSISTTINFVGMRNWVFKVKSFPND